MMIIEYYNNEKKGFDIEESKAKVIKFLLLDMAPGKVYEINESQVEKIKEVWKFIHAEYIQNEFYFIFNINFTKIKKLPYEHYN